MFGEGGGLSYVGVVGEYSALLSGPFWYDSSCVFYSASNFSTE